MIAALSLLLSAHATPSLPGDPLQAAPAALDTLGTPALRAETGFTAAAQLSHARGLVVFQTEDGEVRPILTGTTGLQLGAVWGGSRADVAVTLPSYLQLSGEQFEAPGGAVGDLGVQLRGAVTPWLSAQIGSTLPTGDAERFAGYGQVTGSLGLIAGGESGRVRAAYQFTPTVDLGTESFDDFASLSAAWTPEIQAQWRLSAELDLQLRRQALGLSTGELLVGSHHTLGWGSLHIGTGLGLLRGPGTPAWRLVVGVRRAPPNGR